MCRNHQNQRKAIIVDICHIIYLYIRGSNIYDSHWFTHNYFTWGMQYWRLPPTTYLLPLSTIPLGPRVAYLAFWPWPHQKWPSPVTRFSRFSTFRSTPCNILPKKKRREVFQSGGFPGQSHQSHPQKKKHKQGLFWAQSLAELSAISGAMGKGLNRGNCARRVDSAWDFFLEMEMP